MSWWAALLTTAGVIGFWPVLLVVGDWVDARWQARQAAAMSRGGEPAHRVGDGGAP